MYEILALVSQENVELVRHGIERFVAGEVLWETLDEQLEVRIDYYSSKDQAVKAVSLSR